MPFFVYFVSSSAMTLRLDERFYYLPEITLYYSAFPQFRTGILLIYQFKIYIFFQFRLSEII